MEAIVAQASDRHRQLLSHLHSATIFHDICFLARMTQSSSFSPGVDIAL